MTSANTSPSTPANVPEQGSPSLALMWIAWERQIRNRSMARGVGAELLELDWPGGRFNRYARALIATIRTIAARKPDAVVGMNPSVALNLLLLLLRGFYGFVFVSDAHFGGIHPFNSRPWLQKILNFINSKADLVIVTNDNHRQYVHSLGGTAFVCQDPLPPAIRRDPPPGVEMEKSIFLVCDFAVDEPYKKVFAAAGMLQSKGFHLYVSGNYHKAGLTPSQFPGVTLLGFVEDEVYWSYLGNCSVVIDLTNWDDCLVCGAYEALALGQVLVLSDTPALRGYFQEGALYTGHEPAAIAETIERAYREREEQRRRALKWKTENIAYMDKTLRTLRKTIIDLSNKKMQQQQQPG